MLDHVKSLDTPHCTMTVSNVRDGFNSWSPDPQMHVPQSLDGYWSPDNKTGIGRQYSELYNRGITIKFVPQGTVRSFDFYLLVNMLVQGSVLAQVGGRMRG